jgi:hypothetical protein
VKETTRLISDMVLDGGPTDASDTFSRLKGILDSAYATVSAHFELVPDSSTEQFADYGAISGEPRGSLNAYTGPQIDWLVHSWLGAPHATFTNMHLTAWLGPQIEVPHLGIAFGTLPGPWVYVDYVPRSDLMVDLEALDKYYEPQNEHWLDVRSREDLAPFISRSTYVRAALSETAYCWSAPAATPELMDLLETTVTDHVARWLAWVDKAEPTPLDKRAALAARDEAVRRNVAERDPANVMGDRLFGAEMTKALIRALWGGDRTTPRPQ